MSLTSNKSFRIKLYISLLCVFFSLVSFGTTIKSTINGVVMDLENKAVLGATVIIKEFNVGAVTDINGEFKFSGQYVGSLTIEVSYMGYTTVHKQVIIDLGETKSLSFILRESEYELEEIVVTGKSEVQQVKDRAFSVSVVDAKKLHNTSLDLGHALDRVSGVRVRESGGVGSQMNFSLNGFRGNQVRFFMDGVPMDNFGSSFQINNIPVGLAERIEVYKGVVPVGLGADALGGAVNIITNSKKKDHMEASYSYGSFNTHRFSLNAVYVSKSGLTAQLNAFQNFSDNSYKMKVDVADLKTGEYFPNRTVKRFHDKYHNETVILNLGVLNKSYADQLLFGVTLGQNYKEIQTGARVSSVFGAWHRKGNIVMPSIKYSKDDFLIKNLDLKLNANINLGQEKNIDTINRRYNWLGDYKEYDTPGGERSYSLYKYKNNTGISTSTLSYTISAQHQLVLSNTFNTFNRVGHNELAPDNETYEHPKKTKKNIAGLGYDYKSDAWNTSVFLKHYYQLNKFAQPYNPTGNYGDVAYRRHSTNFNSWGYGLAATYFLTENLQFKGSFEKSYRMPGSEELFGDVVNLEGNIDLKPESSNNFNLGTSYWWNLNSDNQITFNASGFYRKAKDFIRPRLNRNQAMQIMDNLGSVSSAGIEGEISYRFDNRLFLAANVTYQDLRNTTKYEDGQTTQSIVYKDRIPNMPYLYGNADVSYTFPNLWGKEQQLTIGYNALYVHSFYLYWPSLGSDKLDVPEQISHELNLSYKFKNMQFTLEVRNLLNSDLYDNFSLQKPGRNFTGKIKYTFF